MEGALLRSAVTVTIRAGSRLTRQTSLLSMFISMSGHPSVTKVHPETKKIHEKQMSITVAKVVKEITWCLRYKKRS